MDYFTWWLAIAVFFHQFQCPDAGHKKVKAHEKAVVTTDGCKTTLGQEKRKCEKGSMLPCLKNRTALESLKGQLVLCDTKTDGGGWVIIQRRIKGDVEFENKTWAQYRDGFGSFDGDLWIGNAMIRKLTHAGYTNLRIDMEYHGEKLHALYTHFKVKEESHFYQMSYKGFSGNVRHDDFKSSNGMKFATFDFPDNGCSLWYGRTGWWWQVSKASCGATNLNGIWACKDYGKGIYWVAHTTNQRSLSFVEMKLRKSDP
ncbi:ficolin-1-A-like [Physella acuta]|uniref:ficolin-1-A-like n=1 Tax=Physella acuta TaxID=109671 RepID=UPI0027DD1B56|nr:ficolin-1-A-like [Physella acuta]